MNKAIFIGNVGAAPTVTVLENGSIVAKFDLATTENYVDKDNVPQSKTQWHRIVAWGKTAEIVRDYVTKGKCVSITAQAETRSYDHTEKVQVSKTKTIDFQTKRYVTEFRAYDLKVY